MLTDRKADRTRTDGTLQFEADERALADYSRWLLQLVMFREAERARSRSMQTQDLFVGAVTTALGMAMSSARVWAATWLLERRGARSLVTTFGNPAARILLGLLGLALIALGTAVALGLAVELALTQPPHSPRSAQSAAADIWRTDRPPATSDRGQTASPCR